MQCWNTTGFTYVGFSPGPPLNTEERRPFLPTPHPSGTSEETPSQEIMSGAFECPLVHRISSLQIQPLNTYASQDTYVHPNDHIDESKNTSFLLHSDKVSESETYDQRSGDAYTPPLAKQLTLRQINIHSISKHKVPKPPTLHRNLFTAINA